MLTLEEFHQILKSRPFKSSVDGSTESYIFRFTQIYMFRDTKLLCIYELIQEKESFKLVFADLYQNVYAGDFKNVTIVIPGDNRFPQIINCDSLAIRAGKGFDITLVGQ